MTTWITTLQKKMYFHCICSLGNLFLLFCLKLIFPSLLSARNKHQLGQHALIANVNDLMSLWKTINFSSFTFNPKSVCLSKIYFIQLCRNKFLLCIYSGKGSQLISQLCSRALCFIRSFQLIINFNRCSKPLHLHYYWKLYSQAIVAMALSIFLAHFCVASVGFVGLSSLPVTAPHNPVSGLERAYSSINWSNLHWNALPCWCLEYMQLQQY